MAEEVRMEEQVVPLRVVPLRGIDPLRECPDKELGGERKMLVRGVKEELRN